jgi:hypothetical protein
MRLFLSTLTLVHYIFGPLHIIDYNSVVFADVF